MATRTRKAKEVTEEAPEEKGNVIHTKQLAERIGTTGTALRKVLRQHFYPDNLFTVYEWNLDDPAKAAEVEAIVAKFNEVKNGVAERKAAAATKTKEPRAKRAPKVVAEDDLEETDELEELGDDDEEDMEDLDDEEEEETI